jgi:branched-chain amino acid transport system permease protein
VLPGLGGPGGLDRSDGGGRRPSPWSWIVGGLGAGLRVRALLGLGFPQQAYAAPDPLRIDALTPGGLLRLPGGSTAPVRAVCVLALGLAVGLLIEAMLARTRFGLSLRAVADDPAGAALCGVAVRRVVLAAFVMAGLLAGLAGVLTAPGRALSAENGAVLGLHAAAAAVLGGVGSVRGALAGGLAVGTIQALSGYAFGSGFYDLAPLVLLVAVLAVRPPAGRSAARLPARTSAARASSAAR